MEIYECFIHLGLVKGGKSSLHLVTHLKMSKIRREGCFRTLYILVYEFCIHYGRLEDRCISVNGCPDSYVNFGRYIMVTPWV